MIYILYDIYIMIYIYDIYLYIIYYDIYIYYMNDVYEVRTT